MTEESDSGFLKDPHGEKSKKQEKKKELEVNIKFRVTPRAVERVFSIAIILVLVYFVFHFAFQEKVCTELITSPTADLITASAVVENKTQEAEPATKETTAPEGNKTVEVKTEPVVPKKKVIDADILLDKNDIDTEGDYPSVEVTGVKYQIKNNADTFRAKVELRWYDKDDTDFLKEKIRATDNPLVAEKQTTTKILTEFSSKWISSENDDEIFIIALYNSEDDKLLDTARVTFSP